VVGIDPARVKERKIYFSVIVIRISTLFGARFRKEVVII
jgi:hypothetical protein